MELGLAAAAILLAQVVKGITGFGAALVAIPVLSLLYGPAQAIVLVATLDLFSGFGLLWEVWPRIRWRLVGALLLPTCLGLQLGAHLLVVLPESALRVAMGGVVAAMGARFLLWPVEPGMGELDRLPRPAGPILWQAAAVGLLGGLMGSSVGTPGPPVVLWARRWFTDRFVRAQVIAWLQGTGIAVCATLVLRGLVGPEVFGKVPWLLPPLALGVGAGAWLSPRLSRATFGRAVGAVLVGSGAMLLFRALGTWPW